MKVALLFLFFFIFSVNPRSIDRSPESDDFIDKLLENLRPVIIENNLDPAELPDGEVGFSQDIGFITLHGSAKVYDGFFSGLSTIRVIGSFHLCSILVFRKLDNRKISKRKENTFLQK